MTGWVGPSTRKHKIAELSGGQMLKARVLKARVLKAIDFQREESFRPRPELRF